MAGIGIGAPRRAALSALALAVLAWAAVVPATSVAATAYVVDRADGTLRSFDTATNRVTRQPIGVGSSPVAVAITPNGRFAYVLNEVGTVTAADLANGFVSSPIAVGGEPQSVAITPDGQFAWVTTKAPGQLISIETATNRVVGGPIAICANPVGVAIAPDGGDAYVACEKGRVWAIDTQTRERVGEPISVGESAVGVAFAPDGSLAYVTDPESGHVAVIDTATRFLGSPIPAPVGGSRPFGVAVAPDGKTGYLASSSVAYAAAFGIPGGQPLGTAPAVEGVFESVAVAPDGHEVYVTDVAKGAVFPYDAQTMQPGPAIPVGGEPHDIAIAPDQPPHASFTVPDGRPGVPLAFNASASSDPDGTVAHYAWSFGDGSTSTAGPSARHTYKRAGDYRVTLTLTDAEGCSTVLVFTGRTASCNGSPSATQTQAVKVTYPGVRVKCPKSAGRRGCHLKLQAFTRRHRGRPESAVSKAHVKAGGRTIVPLRARPAFARSLGTAKRALVRERLSIRGHGKTRFLRLKIVR